MGSSLQKVLAEPLGRIHQLLRLSLTCLKAGSTSSLADHPQPLCAQGPSTARWKWQPIWAGYQCQMDFHSCLLIGKDPGQDDPDSMPGWDRGEEQAWSVPAVPTQSFCTWLCQLLCLSSPDCPPGGTESFLRAMCSTVLGTRWGRA